MPARKLRATEVESDPLDDIQAALEAHPFTKLSACWTVKRRSDQSIELEVVLDPGLDPEWLIFDRSFEVSSSSQATLFETRHPAGLNLAVSVLLDRLHGEVGRGHFVEIIGKIEGVETRG